MRRTDREVKERKDILAIMEQCDICRIALNDSGYPYLLPLNFGLAVTGETIELYFHGALDGVKYDLIQADPRAGFEMDCQTKLVAEQGNCTMEYASVVGRGRMELLDEAEKERVLAILMRHYHQEDFPYSRAALPRTRVFKLVVESVTGKMRMPQKGRP